MPQLASALARAALRFSTGKRLHQSKGFSPERGAHTNVRIAANNLVVSPNMYVNSAQEGGVVQDWSQIVRPVDPVGFLDRGGRAREAQTSELATH
jgi:hypothetical protein